MQNRLVEVFARYGLPERMTMDNGAPWGDTTGSWTALELWLMRQGIRVGHSRPYHPQTQGKLERLHATLKRELLQGRRFTDHETAAHAFDFWRQDYNQERPHEALAWQVPLTRYRPSPRNYNPNPAPPKYDPAMTVRKVDGSGRLSFRNHTLKIGNRRFTRLTNAFSKKIENLEHSVALHFMHYNFARIHKSLRVTPAMEAGLTDHVWEIEDIAALIPTPVASKRGEYEKRVCNRQISN